MELPARALLVIMLGLFCLARGADEAVSRNVLRQELLNSLKGVVVENPDGEALGKVEDFVVELPSGLARFVIISVDGPLSIIKQKRIAPLSVFSVSTVKRDTAFLNIMQTDWAHAPKFGAKDLRHLRSESVTIFNFYQRAAHDPPGARPDLATVPSRLIPTGRVSHRLADSGFCFASDFLGEKVLRQSGEALGRISDLLVDATGRKSVLAIIRTGNWLKPGPSLAVTVGSLISVAGAKLNLDATDARVARARWLDTGNWPAPTDEQIFRFEAAPPDNTAWNRVAERARISALKQSESRRDLTITQKIRRLLVHDDSLSLTARNVKIITDQGRVTLAGPVVSESEGKAINSYAMKVAGASNVNNQLEIE